MNDTRSTFIIFFDFNDANDKSCRYLYQKFPEHYVYLQKERWWKLRQSGFAIGCIYYCNPFASEKYYSRLLLIVVWDARSFEHLRIVEKILYSIFQATYIAQGLLEDNCKWAKCFKKALLFVSKISLRILFAISLVHREITDTIAIWDKFANYFCDDLPYQLHDWPNKPEDLTNPHYDYSLYLFFELLKESGKTFK